MNDPQQQPVPSTEAPAMVPEVRIRGTGIFTPPPAVQPESPAETDAEPVPDDPAGQ